MRGVPSQNLRALRVPKHSTRRGHLSNERLFGQQESPSDVPMKNKGYVHKVRICKLRCKCTLYASVHKTTYVTPSVSAILFCVEPQVRKTHRNPGVCPQTGVPLGRDKVVFLVNNELCLLLEVPQTMDTRFSSWCNLCTVLLKSNTVCCSWGSWDSWQGELGWEGGKGFCRNWAQTCRRLSDLTHRTPDAGLSKRKHGIRRYSFSFSFSDRYFPRSNFF